MKDAIENTVALLVVLPLCFDPHNSLHTNLLSLFQYPFSPRTELSSNNLIIMWHTPS